MIDQQTFDVVVIGAGPAGEVLAGRLGDAELSVAIIEDHLVGGECSYYACMPSKALLRPAEALAEAKRVPGATEAVTGDLDVGSVLNRRDEIIHDLDDDIMLPWLEDHHVTFIRGRGVITGERQVQVDDTILTARQAVVVATGSVNATPPIEGLKESQPWNNRNATTTKDPPASMVILGGGPVGVELSQAFTSLGSRITLIEGMRRLLPREEEFACVQITDRLTEMGVDIRCGAMVTKVQRDNSGVTATLKDGSTAEADEVLAALGRTPATAGIGLENIGLVDGKPLDVDINMCVHDCGWLYAVGDANARIMFTHMGKYQARIAADSILGHDTSLVHGAARGLAPRIVFTDPQVAAVGYTLENAQAENLPVEAIDIPTSANAGSSFHGRGEPGTARIVVDKQRDIIIGATFTGTEVAEFIHAVTIAIVGEVPFTQLRHAVPCFPTRSEIWLGLIDGWESIR